MRFMKNYGKVAHYAPAYAMNDEFSRVLHQQMEFFSNNPSADTLNRVRGEAKLITFAFDHVVPRQLFSLHNVFEIQISNPVGMRFFNLTNKIPIRTIMVENIEKILERGDRIELLVDKTATMKDGAFHFKKQSKRLRQALWMKNAKLL
ncbi:hypothetical protein Godav_015531 [Gossypium davidsonii]|uniref:V-SNARE coiled-coil homology domain-containing protein n=1 Tax=Gossypium davidsonii TaxID=34287 RepID=A0A7J8RNF0_GOSDV|nr:hypothetical protein [Gossypium davidsonii]